MAKGARLRFMLWRWFPWKYLIRRAARKHGFLDPITLWTKFRQFAQPSEVAEPIELLRAGLLFHARGLMNTRIIQHNLDWIWPYWVEQQFNPGSPSFVPRAFSVTHVNLTHRNWTAIGLPGLDAYPILDPRGLLTPFWDSWSLDCWIIDNDGEQLIPSQMEHADQELLMQDSRVGVRTSMHSRNIHLNSIAEVREEDGRPVCRMEYTAWSDESARLVIALRPYNPEGVSFINDISLDEQRQTWQINNEQQVELQDPVETHLVSTYKQGDVFHDIGKSEEQLSVHCDVGLANAAAMYQLPSGERVTRTLKIPLHEAPESETVYRTGAPEHSWEKALAGTADLEIPDHRMEYLFDAAVRSLILLSPDWIYPGPYTYKRFWYRDAALMLNGLLGVNAEDFAERVVERLPEKQNFTGFFHSQEGEWDSNGAVLWILRRFVEFTGEPPSGDVLHAVRKGAKWIARKRLSDDLDELHAGLMPSGFSAEHLGNIDFYYWDDFWSAGGLFAASELLHTDGSAEEAESFRQEAEHLLQAVQRSLEKSRDIRNQPGLPASPHRRMDSGAVGSIVAGYPLQLYNPQDKRLLHTVEYLIQHCFVDGAFFQDMIHSGLNAYLTLHIAQVLLRAGDTRFREMVRKIAELASPTGQWPEAIHPGTSGGCMGDGHHGWASAEWVMMLRNMFVRENDDRLVIGSGILPEWLKPGEQLFFGPTKTPYGDMSVRIQPEQAEVEVSWEANWRETEPSLEILLPGVEPSEVLSVRERNNVTLNRTQGEDATRIQ